jgi:4-aminobutyrate aminotransferase
VVLFYVGGNVLEITPPLTISDAEIDHAVEILEQAIVDVLDGAVTDEDVAPFAGW